MLPPLAIVLILPQAVIDQTPDHYDQFSRLRRFNQTRLEGFAGM
jgi:hypothetical protein